MENLLKLGITAVVMVGLILAVGMSMLVTELKEGRKQVLHIIWQIDQVLKEIDEEEGEK